MRRRSRKTDEGGVDISPLIDMVFILLIFFMVTTTFVKDVKVEIERPSAASATRASTKSMRVHIDQNGGVYLNAEPIRLWMLQSHIKEALRSGGGEEVLVVTDRRVPAERLIEVVDQVRLGGAKDVGVATKEEAGT